MPHELPTATPDDPLASFTGFFKAAHFDKGGHASIIFTLSDYSKHATMDLSESDGMALNVTVWATKLDDEDEALMAMAQALGLSPTAARSTPTPPPPPPSLATSSPVPKKL